MREEPETVGRCGWVALGLVVLLIAGLLSGGVIGGTAGLHAGAFVLLRQSGSELMFRIAGFAGMVVGLLLAALITMFLANFAGRIISALFRRVSTGFSTRRRPSGTKASI